jgi:hypothetical protein
MPRTLHLDLSATQRAELEQMRDHHPKPHLREKAAALLKIAAGQKGVQVAKHGLLKARDSDTLYRWMARYQAEGIAGLQVRTGRGRKPAFSPRLPRRSSGAGGAAGGAAQCP